MRADLVAAYRSLTASKTFTAAAVAVLALGIGATTAIYSVVDATLLRRLPYFDSDRLVEVREHDPSLAPGESRPVAPQNFLDWDAAQDVFESLAAVASRGATAVAPGVEPEDLQLRRTTADFFGTLRFAAAIGRTFGSEHEVTGRDRVVVLSYAYWQRRYGGDPGAIGRLIPLDGEPYETVGVLAPDAVYPAGSVNGADAYVPYVVPTAERVRTPGVRASYLTTIARLKPGVSLADAQARMDQIAAALRAEHPAWNEGHQVRVLPLRDATVGEAWRSWLWLLLGAAGVVLLIACVNVAMLQLARAAAREHEMSVRASLGGRRWRLMRQLLVENVLLALIGTLVAIAIATWSVELFKAALPGGMPRLAEVRVDVRVLGVATAMATLAGLAFGLAPALHLSNPRMERALNDATRMVAARASGRVRRALVVVEIAMTVVLLVGASLFVRAFAAAVAIRPGFETAQLLTVTVTAPLGARPSGAQAAVAAAPAPDQSSAVAVWTFQELVDRLSEVPGVTAVAFAQPGLPLGGSTSSSGVEVRGRTLPDDASVIVRKTTPGYHAALGVPLLAGRLLSPDDRDHATPPMVANNAAVRAYFSGASPLGAIVVLGGQAHVVVGVVGDVRGRLEDLPRPEVHVPLWAGGRGPRPSTGQLALRTAGDPYAVLPEVRRVAAEVLSASPLRNIATMEERVTRETAWRRFDMWLIGLFGVLGLVVAAVGVYGTLAYGVERRAREIGVRMALGASPGAVARLVLSEAGLMVVTGLVVGAVAAGWLSTIVQSHLYGVGPHDPMAFATAATVMALAVVVASIFPVRRAVRVNPGVALRSE